MQRKSPFKFLDSYSKQDKDIFFGREDEIEDIYTKVFQSKLLLIYGASGTGKSSLINCGLANKFEEADWLPINVRRRTNINQSLTKQLTKHMITPLKKEGSTSLTKQIKSVYLDYFKPIFLIFDQFEELFIFGNEEEWGEFASSIKSVLESNLQVRFIFAIRGEYLEYLTEFEKTIPDFFNNRLRIEKMTRLNAQKCIEGPCEVAGIVLEEDFPDLLLHKLSPSSTVELTYLQVFLDRIYKKAIEESDSETLRFSNELLQDIGDIGDVLSEFVDEQIALVDDSEAALTILKAFVTSKGTKKQISAEETIEFSKTLGKEISIQLAERTIQELVNRRILKDKDESGRYELRHDSIAEKIFEKITNYEREMIEVRQFLEHEFEEFEKRNSLLTEGDLQYVLPYVDRLRLPERIREFIDQSAEVNRKKKRSKIQLYGVLTIIGTLLIITAYSLVSVRKTNSELESYTNALKDTTTRLEEEREALRAIRNTLQDKTTKLEDQTVKLGEQNSELADQTAKAQRARADAEDLRRAADQRSEQDRIKAAEEAEMRFEAQKAEKYATTQTIKATRLQMLALAQSLAAQSLRVQDPQLRALLALQAYKFNIEYDGDDYQPELYDGLLWATKSMGKSNQLDHSHSGLVVGILPFPSQAMTVGGDGDIISTSATFSNAVQVVDASQKNVILSATKSSDDRFVAVGSADGEIYIYDQRKQNESPKIIRISKGKVIDLGYQNAGSLVSLSSQRIQVYASSGTVTDSYKVGMAKVFAIHPSDRFLIYDSSSYLLKIDLTTRQRQQLSEMETIVTQLAVHNTGEKYAVGLGNGNIAIMSWDGEVEQVLTGHISNITDMDFSADGNLLVSSSLDRTIRIWNLADLSKRPIVIDDSEHWLTACSFVGNLQIITGDARGNLNMYTLDMQELSANLCPSVTRDFSEDEWFKFVSADTKPEKPCEP